MHPPPERGFIYIVRGSGIMFTGCLLKEKSLTIPALLGGKPVTILGGHHLANHTNLTSIVIPEMVTDIGMEAFANCTALSRITLPGNVKSIARTRRAIPNN